MSSHACDRALRFGVIVALLATLAGCSGRGTNPDDNEVNPAIHEPFANEEAELLALIMSGELCAPKNLYDQVNDNLLTIRDRWGDSITYLRSIQYRPFWSPSYLGLGVDDDALTDMKAGTYSAWDSLNEYFHLDQVVIPHSEYSDDRYAALSFVPRLDPRRLTAAYAGLPGLRWVQPNAPAGDWSCIYGGLHGATATYLFRHAWGDCPSGCLGSEFWYFRADDDSVAYIGNWTYSSDTTRPEWWSEARTNWGDYYGDPILWERTDTYVPTTITDLRVGNPGSNEVTLTWTAPSDSSYSGRVGSYVIGYASTPITEETWNDADHVTGPAPSLPGVEESFRLTGLTSDSDFYFAVKSGGSDGSPSPISNEVSAATLVAPGWSTFDSTNSALPDSWIGPMAADNQGGLWVATSQGLAYYDGATWKAYTSATTGIGDGTINGMVVDQQGDVWCAASDGVHRFNGGSWSMTSWQDIGLPGVPMSIACAPLGDIFIGSMGFGVAMHHDAGWTVTRAPLEPTIFDGCSSIAFGSDDDAWIGTFVGGLLRLRGSGWTIYDKHTSGIVSNTARWVGVTRTNTVWIGHDIVPYVASRYEDGTWSYFDRGNSELSGRIRGVMVDTDDHVWFAARGAVRFDGASFAALRPTNSGLVSEAVSRIVQDSQGNLWFGTDRGVSRLEEAFVGDYLGAEFHGNL